MPKEDFCGCSRINHYDGDISELNLIDGPVCLRPDTILFCCILPDLGEVTDQRQATRALKAGDAS